MKCNNKCLIIHIILSISVSSFGQAESGKYDSITIKLNIHNSPDIFFPVMKAMNFYHQNHPELLSDYKCLDSTSVPTILTKMALTSGTSWDLYNPPKEPTFFFFRLLFKSNNKAVVDRFNYVRFLSICEAIDGIPYDLIEKINSYWTFWNIENKEDIKAINIFDNTTKSIIEKGGTKCISVEYELVPDLVEEFKVIRSEVTCYSENNL